MILRPLGGCSRSPRVATPALAWTTHVGLVARSPAPRPPRLRSSPFFFMFHMGTKAHYYDSTLKYGGAKYRPTGRGFVLQHEEFAELFRFHAASHLYNGFELLWGLLLLLLLGRWPNGVAAYWRTTWSLWAVMISWLFAPFWCATRHRRTHRRPAALLLVACPRALIATTP